MPLKPNHPETSSKCCLVPVADTVYKELEATVVGGRPTLWADGTQSFSHRLHSVSCMDFQESEVPLTAFRNRKTCRYGELESAREQAEGFRHRDPTRLGR